MTTDMDRAPSHRKRAWPRAAEVAQRLAAGDTLADIARECGRTERTLRQHLCDGGYDSRTALPLGPVTTPLKPHHRWLHVYALRYTPGSELARRTPETGAGRFTLAEAERVRAACVHASEIEIVDVTA